MGAPVLDGERDGVADIEMVLPGLCGRRDEPSGRRCFRRAGHEGRCALLAVSQTFGGAGHIRLPDTEPAPR